MSPTLATTYEPHLRVCDFVRFDTTVTGGLNPTAEGMCLVVCKDQLTVLHVNATFVPTNSGCSAPRRVQWIELSNL